ncbi:hypothetical protein [Streptomyces sp. WG-D5]
MRGPDRLDAVVIEVLVSPAQARAAGLWDGEPAAHPPGRLWFCERIDASGNRLPLLDGGVVLRLRETPHRKAEAVAELRPCRRSRIAGHRPGRVEEEWRGERRVLTATVTAYREEGFVARTLARGTSPRGLLSAEQWAFLDACADRPGDLHALRALGPVAVRHWTRVGWAGMQLDVQRWRSGEATGGGFDFVRLSRRVDRPGAELAQLALESALRLRGVDAWEARAAPDLRQLLSGLASARR